MSTGAVLGLIAGILVLVLIIWVISGYNSFIKMKNSIEEAFSTMDAYLKKRFDLIPNLVDTVKGYAKHEKSTLEQVIKARNGLLNSETTEDRLKNENILSGTLKSLFAVSEAYPELKANENFLDLQSQLKTVEEDILNSRKYYNAVVKRFNTKCETFPNNIIAGIFHFTRQPMYEVDNTEERKNIKVEL